MSDPSDIVLPATLSLVGMDIIHDNFEEKPFSVTNVICRTLAYSGIFTAMYYLACEGVYSNKTIAKAMVSVVIVGVCVNQFSHLSKHKKFVFPQITLPRVKIEYSE